MKRPSLLLITILNCFVGLGTASAQVNSSWNGGNGNWSNAASWTPGSFAPINGNGGNNYNVTINSGVITVDVPIAIQALTLSGGVSTSQNLAINGLFNWADGGFLIGSGLTTANGGVSVTGSAPPSLASTFVNNSNAIIGRTLHGEASAVWNNSASGVIEVGSNSGFFANSGIPTINNSGTLQKTLGVPDSSVAWQVNCASTGVVNIQTGRLSLTGGGTWSSGASITLGTDATLLFSAGTFTFGNTTVTNNGGTLQFSLVDGLTVNGTFTATGTGHTAVQRFVTFNGASTLNEVGVFGTWGGSGNVAVNGLLTLTSGGLTGTGTTTANGGLKINNPQIESVTISRTLINNGVATFEGDGDLTGTNTAVLNNSAGSSFDVRINRNINASGGIPVFNNSGFLKKSIANGTTFFGWQINNQSGGSIQTIDGTLAFSGGGTISSGSTMVATAGTIIGLDSGITLQPGATFTGSGTLRMAGTITVPSGTLTLDGPVSLSGFLNGSGNVILNGAFTLTSGGQIGPTGTVTVNGNMISEGMPTPVGLNATLNTFAATAFGGSVFGSAFAVWNNQPGAILDFVNDSGLPVNAGVPVFNNAGTVKKSLAVGNFTNISWQFNTSNTATVSLEAGQMWFSGGGTWTTGTTVSTVANTTLKFNSGTYFIGSLAVINAGTINFSATETSNSALTVPGQTVIGSGTLTLNDTSSFGSVFQAGGTWTGTGNVSISGVYTWSGGTLTGTGTTTANGNVVMSGSNVTLGRPLINTAMATMSNATNLIAVSGAAWTNAAGSSFDIQANNNLTVAGGAPTPIFTNDGTLIKTSNSTSTSFDWTLNQGATGSFSLQLGSLTLTAGGTFASGSATTVANSTIMHFSGGTFNLVSGSTLTSAGLLRFGGTSATTTIAGSFTQTGTTDILGGTTIFNGSTVDFVAVNQSGGNWRGSSNVTISGLFTWSGSTIGTGGGATTANGGVTISGGVTLARGFTNNGTTTLASGGSLTGNPGATWSNPPGSLFNITSNGGLPVTVGLPAPAFSNASTFRKSLGTGTSTVAWGFTNTGVIQGQTGTLTFSAGVTNTGTVTVSSGAVIGGAIITNAGGTANGSGTFSGTALINSGGSITPGTASTADTLTVGTSTIASGGTYVWNVENAGPNGLFADVNNTAISSSGSGVQDVLTVTGNLNWTSPVIQIVGLAGNGFDNTKAYSWRLGTYGGTASVSNPSFTASNFTTLPASAFTLNTLSNTVILNYNPVPEPMCIFGILAIISTCRRISLKCKVAAAC